MQTTKFRPDQRYSIGIFRGPRESPLLLVYLARRLQLNCPDCLTSRVVSFVKLVNSKVSNAASFVQTLFEFQVCRGFGISLTT